VHALQKKPSKKQVSTQIKLTSLFVQLRLPTITASLPMPASFKKALVLKTQLVLTYQQLVRAFYMPSTQPKL
jgi:hypothetical protein